MLHDRDAPLHDWDPAVSSNPDDPHFSFSFAGHAFFIIGLHPGSTRLARQFPWPTLVFMPYIAFIDTTQRTQLLGTRGGTNNFWRYVAPHEIAHQWWGHTVGWDSITTNG